MTNLARNGLATIFGSQQEASWPDSAESTGDFLKVVHKIKYWEAKGPARDAFEILSPDIINHLEQYLDSLPSSIRVTFSVYMVGEDPERTHPVVVFICDQTGPCREAQRLIDESRLLAGFPGMTSDIAAVPPDFDYVDQLASHPTPLPGASSPDRSSLASVGVTGKRVSVTTLTESGPSSQSATLGGFVQHNQETYIYTVGHLFQPPIPQERASQPASLQDGQSAEDTGTARAELAAFSTDLDYALLKVHDPASILRQSDDQDFRSTRPTHVVRAPLKTTSINATTVSAGMVKGTLYATPSFTRLPNSKSFQRVYRARFSRPLAKGDCGAWVVDEGTRGLYGHIIAGGEHNAYIVPAHDVFQNAEEQLGDRIRLLENPYADFSSAELRARDDPQEDLTHGRRFGVRTSFTDSGYGSSTKPMLRDQRHEESMARRKTHPCLKASKSARLEIMNSATHTSLESTPSEGSVEIEGAMTPHWDILISTGHADDGILGDENVPWGEVPSTVAQCDEDGCGDEDFDDGQASKRVFMHELDVSDISLHQAEFLEEYVSTANVESLQADIWTGQKLPCKAWIAEGGEGWFRPGAESLTAHQLYQALRNARSRSHESPPSSDGCAIDKARRSISNPMNDSRPAEHKVHDAVDTERRLIFVTDLDAWAIHALIATASVSQARALLDAVFKHLTFQSSIEVAPSCDGWPSFQLEFHLPYYAWRSSREPREDSRLDSSREPLRNFRDVSLLDCEGSTSFLYEAQISCVISGVDEWRWVAYGFVDSYFDREVGGNAGTYLADITSGVHGVPGGYGATGDAGNPPEKARDFFLKILQVRVKQIIHEWEQVLRNVERGFRKYAKAHETRIARPPAPENWEERGDSIMKSLNWTAKALSFLTELSEVLSRTLNAWAVFEQEHLVKFKDPKEPWKNRHSVHAIRRSFHRLQSVRESVDSMAKTCCRMKRELQLQLTYLDMELGEEQRKLAKASYNAVRSHKQLSFMVLYISPVALASAVFSMDQQILPFIPQTTTSFLFLILGFSMLGFFIHHTQTYRDHHPWGSLVAKARSHWQAGPWSPSLEALSRRLRGSSRSQPNEDTQDDEKDRLWALWNGQDV